jgi:hypothetical protein
MSEKTETGNIRISQVFAGAMAAATAAVLGSTMGFAGTVIGAGLASVVTTVGGTLYLRSIQRTKQGVQSVRNLVVARAGGTSVTLLQERPVDTEPDPDAATERLTPVGEPAAEEADPDAVTRRLSPVGEATERIGQAGADTGTTEQPPVRRIRWPAVIAASVLAFLLGMLVITGVEWVRGEPLSGGEGTTVGRIVRTDNSGGEDSDDKAPPPATTSTTPTTGDSPATVTTPPPTSENEEPTDPPGESGEPETTAPETTGGGEPTGSAPAPAPQSGAAG